MKINDELKQRAIYREKTALFGDLKVAVDTPLRMGAGSAGSALAAYHNFKNKKYGKATALAGVSAALGYRALSNDQNYANEQFQKRFGYQTPVM